MTNDEYLDYLFNKEVAIILKKKREEKGISLEELSNRIHNNEINMNYIRNAKI